MPAPQISPSIVDLVFSFKAYLPLRATSTHQGGQKDQLLTILENELMRREILWPPSFRPAQLRLMAIRGWIPRMKMLLRFTDVNAPAEEDEWVYDEDGVGEHYVVEGPSTPLQAALCVDQKQAVRVLCRAGASGAWHPSLALKMELRRSSRRTVEDLRRAREDRRRATEDLRRATEDRRRAREDHRRAKEDAKRSRQDARNIQEHSVFDEASWTIDSDSDVSDEASWTRDLWQEDNDDDIREALAEQDEEDENERQREECDDDMQEALADQVEKGEYDEGTEDKTDDTLQRAELQRATEESAKIYRESECQRENADIAEALMLSMVEPEAKSSSAPGRLQHEGSSTCSSWRRAARAIPEIDTTSQVTPEPWDDAAWQSAALTACSSDADDAHDPAGHVPQQPPGIFYPSTAAACQEASTASCWKASTLANTSMHLANRTESPVGSVQAVDPPSPTDHGNSHACASQSTGEATAGQGTNKTKRRNRMKYDKKRRQAPEGAALLDEMD